MINKFKVNEFKEKPPIRRSSLVNAEVLEANVGGIEFSEFLFDVEEILEELNYFNQGIGFKLREEELNGLLTGKEIIVDLYGYPEDMSIILAMVAGSGPNIFIRGVENIASFDYPEVVIEYPKNAAIKDVKAYLKRIEEQRCFELDRHFIAWLTRERIEGIAKENCQSYQGRLIDKVELLNSVVFAAALSKALDLGYANQEILEDIIDILYHTHLAGVVSRTTSINARNIINRGNQFDERAFAYDGMLMMMVLYFFSMDKHPYLRYIKSYDSVFKFIEERTI